MSDEEGNAATKTGAKATPQRSCVACRASVDRGALLRVVWDGERLVADPTRSKAGRGAYVHPFGECLARAGQGALWERAFRLSRGSLAPSAVATLAAFLSSATSAGSAFSGVGGKIARRGFRVSGK